MHHASLRRQPMDSRAAARIEGLRDCRGLASLGRDAHTRAMTRLLGMMASLIVAAAALAQAQPPSDDGQGQRLAPFSSPAVDMGKEHAEPSTFDSQVTAPATV